MRHGNKVKKLGRTQAHRKATLSSLSAALIMHKRITTTLAKAKALRMFVEPIINRAKDTSTNSRRQAFRRLGDKEATKALFGEVAEALGDRPGGYTRVVKIGMRAGDAAEMAIIELVDFNDVKPDGGAATKRKTRRSRRRAGEGAPAAGRTAPAAAPKTGAAAEDDLTRLKGVGRVFATALNDAGIRTFAQLAKADLNTLRAAVEAGSKVGEASANEETWAAQAAFAAAGDWDGLEAYNAQLDAAPAEPASAEPASAEAAPAEDGPEESTPEDAAPEGAAAEATSGSGPAPASPAAEAVHSGNPNPVTTGNPQIPQGPSGGAGTGSDHRDAEQGTTPGTGDPVPESHPTNLGRGGHRG